MRIFWRWFYIAVGLCLRCYYWIEEHWDGIYVILELVWFGWVEVENGRRRCGLVWFVCLLFVFSLQWERRGIAITNRSARWMLNNEIHIPAECSSLQSLGLWFWLLLDISASTLHTIHIQCRRRRVYSAKGRACYWGVILLLRAAFWWGYGSPLFSYFQAIHKFVQFFALGDGSIRVLLCSIFVLFCFKKLCTLCTFFIVGEGKIFGSSELRRPGCIFHRCEDFLRVRIIIYVCTHQIIAMRVRSKELLAMPSDWVHYFISKSRSYCFSLCWIVVF